jgi:hypothetical protein
MRLIEVDGFRTRKFCRCRDIVMLKRLCQSLALLFAVAVHGALQNPTLYGEMCDASAGVALDENHFAVADDEGNVLRVYKRGNPEPIHEFDVRKFLGNTKNKESDVEGAARVGERIYWIGSHGRNRAGEPSPSRQMFFATRIEGKKGRKLQPEGQPYSGLLDELLADERFKRFGLEHASLLAPKHKGGLNIEAMCARADGALLIGFRNPVPHGKGLIVPLLNPDKVIHGERAKFGDMITLDLGGFGVRDFTPVGNGLLIIAGSTDGKKQFQLYDWDGKAAKPQLIPGNFFEDLNPEAIFHFPDDPAGVFQILSDDGGRKTGGRPCKEFPKEQRHFRAGELQVTLPAH